MTGLFAKTMKYWMGRGSPALLLGALLAFACDTSNDRPPPPTSETEIDLTDLVQYDTTTADARDVYASGACEDGATRECRVYLPSHNDVQPCFVGQQLCVDSSWGECGSGVVVDANDDDAELAPEDLPR
jgi:hypothetical protein